MPTDPLNTISNINFDESKQNGYDLSNLIDNAKKRFEISTEEQNNFSNSSNLDTSKLDNKAKYRLKQLENLDRSLQSLGPTSGTGAVRAWDSSKAGFETFYHRHDYDKLGFSPYRNNYDIYKQNESFISDAIDVTKGFTNLQMRGMWWGIKSWGSLIQGGDPDPKAAAQQASIMQNYAPISGGKVGNFFLNVAFTVGMIQEAMVEEGLILALTAALKNPEVAGMSEIPLAKIGISLGQFVKRGAQIAKNLKTMEKAEKARQIWSLAKSAGAGLARTVNPFSNTTEVISALRKSNKAEQLAKLGEVYNKADLLTAKAKGFKTFTGFFRDAQMANFALAESRLESGGVYNDVYKSYMEDNLNPTIADIRFAHEQAMKAANHALYTHWPLIYYTDKIAFENLFKMPEQAIFGKAFDTAGGKIIGSTRAARKGKDVFKYIKDGLAGDIKKMGTWPGALEVGWNYTKANFMEGIQETSQDIINEANTNYYIKDNLDIDKVPIHTMYHNYKKAINDEVSSKGLETFVTAFLTAIPIKAGGHILKPAFKGTGKLIKRVKLGKERYTEYKNNIKEREQIYDDYMNDVVKSMNDYYKHPDRLNELLLENTAFQKRASEELKKATNLNDIKKAHDVKDEIFFKHILTAIETGTFDTLVDHYKELTKLTDDELLKLNESEGDRTAEQIRAKLNNLVSRANNIKSRRESILKSIGNPLSNDFSAKRGIGFSNYISDIIDKDKTKSKRYKELFDQSSKKAILNIAYNQAVEFATFNANAFDRANERINSLTKEIAGIKQLKDTSSSDIVGLYDSVHLQGQINLLKAEIENETDTTKKKELSNKLNSLTDYIEKLNKLINLSELSVAKARKYNSKIDVGSEVLLKKKRQGIATVDKIDGDYAILSNGARHKISDLELANIEKGHEVKVNTPKDGTAKVVSITNGKAKLDDGRNVSLNNLTNLSSIAKNSVVHIGYDLSQSHEVKSIDGDKVTLSNGDVVNRDNIVNRLDIATDVDIHNVIESDRQKITDEMIQFLQEKSKSLLNKELSKNDAIKLFTLIRDYHILNKEKDNLEHIVNMVIDPTIFYDLVESIHKKQIENFENKIKNLKSLYDRYNIERRRREGVLNALYDAGYWVHPDDIESIVKGKVPDKFYLIKNEEPTGIEITKDPNYPDKLDKYNEASDLIISFFEATTEYDNEKKEANKKEKSSKIEPTPSEAETADIINEQESFTVDNVLDSTKQSSLLNKLRELLRADYDNYVKSIEESGEIVTIGFNQYVKKSPAAQRIIDKFNKDNGLVNLTGKKRVVANQAQVTLVERNIDNLISMGTISYKDEDKKIILYNGEEYTNIRDLASALVTVYENSISADTSMDFETFLQVAESINVETENYVPNRVKIATNRANKIVSEESKHNPKILTDTTSDLILDEDNNLKKSFSGKFIYMSPGSGKTEASKLNDNIIDFDNLLIDELNKIDFFPKNTLEKNLGERLGYLFKIDPDLANAIYERAYEQAKQYLQQGKTVLTGSIRMLNKVDIIYSLKDKNRIINHLKDKVFELKRLSEAPTEIKLFIEGMKLKASNDISYIATYRENLIKILGIDSSVEGVVDLLVKSAMEVMNFEEKLLTFDNVKIGDYLVIAIDGKIVQVTGKSKNQVHTKYISEPRNRTISRKRFNTTVKERYDPAMSDITTKQDKVSEEDNNIGTVNNSASDILSDKEFDELSTKTLNRSDEDIDNDIINNIGCK